jgi:REP element-mobilizing transposase RayT
MTTGFQIREQYATHFLTHSIVDWVDVFSRKNYRDIVIESLDYCVKNKGLKLYAYVIMTNHIHLIARSETGKLSDTIRDYKKFTANAILDAIKAEPESRREWMLHRFSWNAAHTTRNRSFQVWTHDNHPETVYSQDFFNQKLNYIHQNPVRAGWVELPEEYLYSSAKAIIKKIPGPIQLEDWHI